tara:strand:- start:546 stop:710 length:165 start_codon:yes stop_codon:yes gene_type:complete
VFLTNTNERDEWLIEMNIFYLIENIHEFIFYGAGTAAALLVLTCSVFCFPKDES